MGLLTSIPILCFAFGSALMPKIAEKIGLERTLLYSVVLLTLGLIFRSEGNLFLLFFASIIVGMMITVGNVLMPPFINKYFPKIVGKMMAIYLVITNIFAAIAVGFSISLGKIYDLGWKSSLGSWMVLSFGAIPFWLYIFKHRKLQKRKIKTPILSQQRMWKSGLAWQISIFIGTQSIVYYSFAAWLPTMLQTWGMTAAEAAWPLVYLQVSQIPMLFIGAILSTKPQYQSPVVWIGSVLMFVGLVLIAVWKTKFIIVSTLCMGVSIGLIFALANMFFILRTNDVKASVRLSGMAQGVGYFITACFPPLVGYLFQKTGSWEISLILLIITPVVMLATGLNAAHAKPID